MSEAVVVFVCVGGNLYTFTAAGVQQTSLIKDDQAKQRLDQGLDERLFHSS